MNKTMKKYTVITGASSGIGYETAKAFADQGKNLIVIARRQNNLEELKQEILEKSPNLDIVIKATDLSVMKKVYQLYDDLKNYNIETWINNAGFGNHDSVANQDLKKTESMLHLNVEALTILSSLYVNEYKDIEGTQLINVSSAAGYTIVPNAVTYSAAKFYISAFTEGLAWELKESNSKMQAKVLAPAATQTEFANIANNVSEYDYDKNFATYHTSQQMAMFLLELYNSDKTVGSVDLKSFSFELTEPILPYIKNLIV